MVSAADLKRIGQARKEGAGEPKASESSSNARMLAPFGELSRPGRPMPEAGVAGEPLQGPTIYVFGAEPGIEEAPDQGLAGSSAEVSVGEPTPAGSTAQAARTKEKIVRKPKSSRSKSSASARRRRPSDDEVQILPSKRGQYRRRAEKQGPRQQGSKAATELCGSG